MTTHADEEADADDFSIFDVESAILSGEIVERQKDAETGNWKYVISGKRWMDGTSQPLRGLGPGAAGCISLLCMRNNTRKNHCENCGQTGVQIRPITRTYGRGASLLVIENVPVIACPHCGASYMTAQTLHEIARIKIHRRTLSKRRNVAVAEFVDA